MEQSYLPSQTPSGLKQRRKDALVNLRGNGQGERQTSDRIYDYDVYNDLGDPDHSPEKKRPVLGGKDHPYPRRCRTGRPRCKTDPLSETRSSNFYVPRDEAFSEVKDETFNANKLYNFLHALIPTIQAAFIDKHRSFPYFTSIDSLYHEEFNLPPLKKSSFFIKFLAWIMPIMNWIARFIFKILKFITHTTQAVLRFETPEIFNRDRFSWFRDEEFSRQTLAGINPYSIQLVREWPLKSKLDPQIYGPPESAITKELVEGEIKGMTLEEALEQKKLFILDYHDLLLPYVNKVRKLEMTTLYGSRTLFFLTPEGTLRLLVIELTRPPGDGKLQWQKVFTPTWDATGCWLWRIAKAHVVAHDCCVHQLVSHWLRTHCAVEPYIIAT